MARRRRPGAKLWHYTTGEKFMQIVKTGAILPAVANVPEGERPVVWFTYRQTWEPTADKAWELPDGRLRRLTTQETADQCGGLVRIGIAPKMAPLTWARYLKRSGVHPRMAAGLASAAKEGGSDPRDWRMSFAAVPREAWIDVEVYTDSGWVPCL